MRKLLLAASMILLAGCPLQAEVVEQYADRCLNRGGGPIYMKDANGAVTSVRCLINDNLYYMGDY